MESLKNWMKENPVLAVAVGLIVLSVLWHLF